MGRDEYSMKCIGFRDALRSSTQWLVLGGVELWLTDDFSRLVKTSSFPQVNQEIAGEQLSKIFCDQ